jgi:hypothetical protein
MRRLAPLFALALGLGLVAWVNARIAAHVAASLGGGLAQVGALMAPSRLPFAPEAWHVQAVDACSSAGEVVVAAYDRDARPGRRRSRGRRRGERVAHGLLVPGGAVLRIVRSGLRPRGVPVPADGAHPAGMLLEGVSALGVGLQDGDVLTRVAGAPASDAGDVIGAVIAARGRLARSISGVFWRDGQPWQLTVEQPYPRRTAQ